MTSETQPVAEMSKAPQVSIGMPVYNGEPFIREALDSLLAQTFTDFELIISDNASNDDTETICRNYASKDERIRYVRHAENKGAPANFRYVLEEAAGKYFMWAACDDFWSEEWLMTLIDSISERDVCVYSTTSFVKNGKVVRKHECRGFKKGGVGKLFLDFKNKALLIYGLYKKDYLKIETKIFDGPEFLGMDHVCLLGLLRHGDLKVVQGATHFYRKHDGQVSHSGGYFFDRIKKLYSANLFRQYIGSTCIVPSYNKITIILLIPFHFLLLFARLIWSTYSNQHRH